VSLIEQFWYRVRPAHLALYPLSLLFGAGVKQGHVHGTTDKIAGYPVDHPVTPGEFVGRLEKRLRMSGAEDLVILLTNGDGPPAPKFGPIGSGQ